MEEKTALLALSRMRGIDNFRKKWIVDNNESGSALFEGKARGAEGIPRQAMGISLKGIDEEIARISSMGIDIVTLKDDSYPPLLRQIADAPVVFYRKGPLPLLGPALAIVGARKATMEGMLLAEQIGETLSAAGVTVVSGLARGVDGAAHKGGLRGRGGTVGVLGCGIDICYPSENWPLFKDMAQKGAIVTEYVPGTRPLKHHFPERNRIIAGLARGVLVVEASAKSGSLITARLALDYGREVMAMPGRVLDEAYKGTNSLIKQGARLVEDISDIVTCCFPDVEFDRKSTIDINEDEDYIYRLMSTGRIHVDELIEKSRLETKKVMAILTRLEMKDMVRPTPGGFYIRKA
jgi:DNA processing protein